MGVFTDSQLRFPVSFRHTSGYNLGNTPRSIAHQPTPVGKEISPMDFLTNLTHLIITIIIFSTLLGIIILAFDVLHAATHPDNRPFSQRVKDRWITDDPWN